MFIFVFSISTSVLAATAPEGIPEIKEKVYYDVIPSKPNLGDVVDITAEMYGTPVKDASFTWKVDGRTVKEGVGANKVNFTLSGKNKVMVNIKTGGGLDIEKTFDFDPKKILLIWESRTYTPPFYKGKSLYSPESSLILNAINIDQDNPLTNKYNNYTWSVDGEVKGDDSGVGYSSYVFQGDILGLEPLFSVSLAGISSYADKQNGKTTPLGGESFLSVQTFPTSIMSFEKAPLLGVLFNKTIEPQFSLIKDDATLVSYPMYYSLSSSLSAIYSWYINDVKINNALNELSFKKTKSDELSRLTVNIKNIKSILQTRDMSYVVDTTRK